LRAQRSNLPDSCVFAAEKCSCIFCIHAIHGNKRSEAIPLAWDPSPVDCRVAVDPRKDVKIRGPRLCERSEAISRFMRLCERSEAIPLAWDPSPGDCHVAVAPRKDVKIRGPGPCERSEAIPLAWDPSPGDCHVAVAPRKDGLSSSRAQRSDLLYPVSNTGCFLT
jgi:hypothetical protein